MKLSQHLVKCFLDLTFTFYVEYRMQQYQRRVDNTDGTLVDSFFFRIFQRILLSVVFDVLLLIRGCRGGSVVRVTDSFSLQSRL